MADFTMYTVLTLLLYGIAVFLPQTALGLRCDLCESSIGWDDCMKHSRVESCSIDTADEHLKQLGYHHSQDSTTGSGKNATEADAGCSMVELTVLSTGESSFRRSCTYDRYHCEGWNTTAVLVKQCTVCSPTGGNSTACVDSHLVLVDTAFKGNSSARSLPIPAGPTTAAPGPNFTCVFHVSGSTRPLTRFIFLLLALMFSAGV